MGNRSVFVDLYRVEENVKVPVYSTEYSACFDIEYYPHNEYIVGYNESNERFSYKPIEYDGKSLHIHSGDRILVPTGLFFKLPASRDFSLRLHPRSGLSLKKGLILGNSEGIIDADYTDELFVMLHNSSKVTAIIKPHERICQGEIVANYKANFALTLKGPPKQITSRVGGFGSTG